MNGASQESVQGKTRHQFSASEKLRLVKAAETALASGERGVLEVLLRQEGIYSSQLSAWRQQFGAGPARVDVPIERMTIFAKAAPIGTKLRALVESQGCRFQRDGAPLARMAAHLLDVEQQPWQTAAPER